MRQKDLDATVSKYRPDIDGLRAFAVFGVVAFHAFPGFFGGGFIGVDVFFVISGFLITTNIFNSLERSDFSFRDFYLRRIRRIFPALGVVLSAILIFGYFALLDFEYKQIGKHTMAGILFVSNLIFWQESGYFDTSSEMKPLLHLWSLAVEEQFYLIWPVICYLSWRKKIKPITVILIILCSSLFWCVTQTGIDPKSAFFLSQSRFWELASGALLACVTFYFPNSWGLKKLRSGGNVIVLASLLSLLCAFIFMTKNMSFPGFWAVLPVACTCFIIASGSSTKVSSFFLANRPMVYVGLISFPLYLWHWPLLSLANIAYGGKPNVSVRLSLVVLSLALALITYEFVERPLRSKLTSRSGLLYLGALAMTLLCMSAGIYFNDGMSSRLMPAKKIFDGDLGHLAYHEYIATKYEKCKPDRIADEAPRWDGFLRCMQSKASEQVDVALVGDSHAEQLFLGLAESISDKNIAFYIKGSAPFSGNAEFKEIFQYITNSRSIQTVVLTMYWTYRARQISGGLSLGDELKDVTNMLTRSGKQVYLIGGLPDFPFEPELCKFNRWFSVRENKCQTSRANFQKQFDEYFPTLVEISRQNKFVKVVDVSIYFCDSEVCRMNGGRDILYRDSNHLNIKGSQSLGRALATEMFGKASTY